MDIIKNKYVISGAATVISFGLLYYYYRDKINKEENPKEYNRQMIYNIIISVAIGVIMLFILGKLNIFKKNNVTTLTSPIDGEKPVNKSSIKLPNKVFEDINVDIMK